MAPIELPAGGWRPRPHQRRLWSYMEHGGKRAIAICHRRWGKDEIALHWAACAAHRRVADYWHCLPQYSQARKAIWMAVNPHTGRRRVDEAFPHALRAQTWEQEMAIRFKNGSMWRVVGSDNPDSLVGTAPAGLVMSEYAMSNPASWGYLAPILAENDGWAMFITTPRGRNHAFQTFELARDTPGWLAERCDVLRSGFPLHRVEEQRREYYKIFGKDAGDALIEQEYFCSFEAAILGAFWGKLLAQADADGRLHSRIKPHPGLPIHRAWDLGKGANMAIWFFQVVGRQVWVLDYVSGHAIGIPGFAKIIRDQKHIRGGIDFVPHDARVVELGTEKSRLETMIACGLAPQLIANHAVADRINAGTRVIPRCHFDATACADGLNGLRNYRADWDQETLRFGDAPVKDWSTHPADAFGYLCYSVEEVTVTRPAAPSKTLSISTGGGRPIAGRQVSLGDLLSLAERPDNPMGYS